MTHNVYDAMLYDWAAEQLADLNAVILSTPTGYDIYIHDGPLSGFHHAADVDALAQMVRNWRAPQ